LNLEKLTREGEFFVFALSGGALCEALLPLSLDFPKYFFAVLTPDGQFLFEASKRNQKCFFRRISPSFGKRKRCHARIAR
jgi:hypothetical protein